MVSKLFALACLSGVVIAAPDQVKRQQATNEAEFLSAASQLISLYVPPSIGISLGAAVQSAAAAAGVTGDINSIVQSALVAPTPPPFLTNVPSQYQSNVVSLEAAISALRGVASTGIPGAPVIGTDSTGGVTTTGTKDVVTTTGTDGATVVGVTGVTTDSAGSTITSVTSTVSTGGSTTSGAKTDTASSTASTTTTNTGSTTTSETSTSTAATTESTTSTESSAPSSSSKALGNPVALAPGAGGIVGLVGLLLAL